MNTGEDKQTGETNEAEQTVKGGNQTQVETVKDWKCRNMRSYQNKTGNGNQEHSENMKKHLFQTSTEKPQRPSPWCFKGPLMKEGKR